MRDCGRILEDAADVVRPSSSSCPQRQVVSLRTAPRPRACSRLVAGGRWMSVFTFRVRMRAAASEEAAQIPSPARARRCSARSHKRRARSCGIVVPSPTGPTGNPRPPECARSARVMGPLHCCTRYFVRFVHSQRCPQSQTASFRGALLPLASSGFAGHCAGGSGQALWVRRSHPFRAIQCARRHAQRSGRVMTPYLALEALATSTPPGPWWTGHGRSARRLVLPSLRSVARGPELRTSQCPKPGLDDPPAPWTRTPCSSQAGTFVSVPHRTPRCRSLHPAPPRRTFHALTS